MTALSLRVFFVTLVIALHSVAILASGHEIRSVRLTPDGSIDPPGDRVDISVLLFPEARNAQIEIAAYIVKGKQNEEQRRILATGDRNTDLKGNFRVASVLRKNGESIDAEKSEAEGPVTRFDRRIVIPFRDLRVPKGEHKLGYVVTLAVEGRPVDSRPTELSTLTVTDKTRRPIDMDVERAVITTEGKPIQFNIWKKNEVVRAEGMVTVERLALVSEKVSATIDIPGEFKRERLFGAASDAASSAEFVPEPRRRIYFATNRREVNAAAVAEKRFGDMSVVATDEMRYGSCVVTIPVKHTAGRIEVPGRSWWFWTERDDPNKHFVINEPLSMLKPEVFSKELTSQDVLVYVHGYNNTFKDSILRSAQLQHDLKFPGKVVAFSWPSAGSTLVSLKDPFDAAHLTVKTAYKHDEEQAEKSPAFLAELLDRLLHEPKGMRPRKVHVLAHSMGNRVLLRALHKLKSDGKLQENDAALGEIILAAADLDGATFSNVRDSLFHCCAHVTFYFASDDAALLLSQRIHTNKPVGLDPYFDEKKMDTISADNLTTFFNKLGHLYATESELMLADIRLLLTRKLPPIQRRPPLGQRIEAPNLEGFFYWTFPTQP